MGKQGSFSQGLSRLPHRAVQTPSSLSTAATFSPQAPTSSTQSAERPVGVWRWPSSPSPSGEGHGACTGANAQHAARHGRPHAHDGGSPMRGPPQLPAYGWVAPAKKGTGMGGQSGGRGPRASRTDAFTHGQQTGGWDRKGVVKVQRVRRLFTIPFPVFPNPGLQVRRGRHGLWLLEVLKGPEHSELPPSVRCRLRFGP